MTKTLTNSRLYLIAVVPNETAGGPARIVHVLPGSGTLEATPVIHDDKVMGFDVDLDVKNGWGGYAMVSSDADDDLDAIIEALPYLRKAYPQGELPSRLPTR